MSDKLGTSGVRSISYGTCSARSGGSNWMGSGAMVWGWVVISCYGNRGYGGVGGFSVIMVVDAMVFGLGSSYMSIIVCVARVDARVRGMVEDIG
jgi:hypothetical protein